MKRAARREGEPPVSFPLGGGGDQFRYDLGPISRSPRRTANGTIHAFES